MLASAPVTASIAVTSFETMFSAARFSSTLAVLSAWSLLRQAARQRAAPATRIKARIRDSKKRGCRQIPAAPQNANVSVNGGVDYIALLVDVLVVVVFVVVVAFVS